MGDCFRQVPKQLRVLDLASMGAAADAYTSSASMWHRRILIRAIDPRTEHYAISRVNRISLALEKGALPGCLCSGPKAHYHHVHWHMHGMGKGFGWKEAEESLDRISAVLADGGIFFFSANHEFLSYERPVRREEARLMLQALDSMIGERFRFVHRHSTEPGFALKESQRMERLKKQFEEHGKQGEQTNSFEFFEKFSDWAGWLGTYFAVARKKS